MLGWWLGKGAEETRPEGMLQRNTPIPFTIGEQTDTK